MKAFSRLFKSLLFTLITSISLLNLSCQRELQDPSDTTNVNPPSTTTFYYKALIGGLNYYEIADDDNEAGSGVGGLDDVDFSASINPNNPGSTLLEISKGILNGLSTCTQPMFKSFFLPGSYSYTDESYSAGNGIQILWKDSKGDLWGSAYGSGNQTGSSFKIISQKDNPDAIGQFYLRVKMQFSCKLYKYGTSEIKQLNNGEMVGLFGPL